MSSHRAGSDYSSGRSSPQLLSALDSSSALILVHDEEDDSTAPFDISSEDEDDDHSFGPYVQSLSPSIVFLYLLSPYLKLGAMLLPATRLPLKFGIPALLCFAFLSAFSRQIWYMLARYFCTTDMEDIILELLAKGRGRERSRQILRRVIRGTTGAFKILLASIYIREAVHLVVPVLPAADGLTGPIVSATFCLFLAPFALAQSLGSQRVIYATWLSLATYLGWFGCITFAHSEGTLDTNPSFLKLGTLWQGITITAFAFTSSSTLSLYASLKAGPHQITTAKSSSPRSFRTLSIISVAIAVSFTLPLVFFAASPNVPATRDSVNSPLQWAIASLQASTLLLAIPSLISTTPSIPMPASLRRSTLPLSKLLIFFATCILSFVPQVFSGVLSDILLVGILTSAYFLPAISHIATHFLRRPLSIIMPSTPSPFTPAVDSSGLDPPNSANDPLLQRKERALQSKQFRKRLLWDLGVWLVLLPVCGSGFVWAVGTLVGRW
ncbi:hypothetical protein C8J56DRAFT_813825 [Mycena floridula]|nr:hypothetical protein C8J56DRAFT_813825 [Mycena floridula]